MYEHLQIDSALGQSAPLLIKSGTANIDKLSNTAEDQISAC